MAFWPVAHLEALREYLGENGVTFSKAADTLNKKFDTEYSRNAVIGKASREKISSSIAPHGEGMERPKKERPVAVRRRKPQPPTPPESFMLRAVEVEPLHITFGEITDQTCKWPYGDAAPFTFCGNPVCWGSYCGAHFPLSKRSSA